MGDVIHLPASNRPPPGETAAHSIRACLTMLLGEAREVGLTAVAFLIEAAIQAIDEKVVNFPAGPEC